MAAIVIPSGYYFTRDHAWAKVEDDVVTVGISDYAQYELGEITYVELPRTGKHVHQGEEAAVVESVKAASDVYAPVSGVISEVNSELEENPELINSDPYNDGWLFRIKASDPAELDDLLAPEEYRQLTEQEE